MTDFDKLIRDQQILISVVEQEGWMARAWLPLLRLVHRITFRKAAKAKRMHDS